MSRDPILEHRALPAVPKILFRKGRREIDELPLRPAGSELVAVVDGEYVKLPGQLHGTEDNLVAASEVLVIDTRPSRQVVAKVELDSSEAGESFVVRVTFSCSVLDAVDVAKRVPHDIVPILENHLKSDPQLMKRKGNEFAAEDVSQLREMVSARVRPGVSAGDRRRPGCASSSRASTWLHPTIFVSTLRHGAKSGDGRNSSASKTASALNKQG